MRSLIERPDILDCLPCVCRGADRAPFLSRLDSNIQIDAGTIVSALEETYELGRAVRMSRQFAAPHRLAKHPCEFDDEVAHSEPAGRGARAPATFPNLPRFNAWIRLLQRTCGAFCALNLRHTE
jgi:hypothetical protein